MAGPNAVEIAIREVNELVEIGDQLIATAAGAPMPIEGQQIAEVMAWTSRVGHIIHQLAGKDSAYETTFRKAREVKPFSYIHSNNYQQLCEIQGALKGLQSAFNAGLFQDLKLLLQADIFADFLEMAEHLLAEGYKDAAAVMIGGVLEDALRKLSQGEGLSIVNDQGRPLTIEPMNVNLAKANVYPPLTKKQITSWADLRNNAAHGNYATYSGTHVKEMLMFVQRFSADYLQ